MWDDAQEVLFVRSNGFISYSKLDYLEEFFEFLDEIDSIKFGKYKVW